MKVEEYPSVYDHLCRQGLNYLIKKAKDEQDGEMWRVEEALLGQPKILLMFANWLYTKDMIAEVSGICKRNEGIYEQLKEEY